MAPMQGGQGEPQRKPQVEHKHPAEWERDLNPNHMAGQNLGPFSEQQELAEGARTAYDLKNIHRGRLRDFNDGELKQIPILATGTRLQQDGTYIDRNAGVPAAEFTATGEMTAGPQNCYVDKRLVPYPIWDRLTGKVRPGQT
ncbi:MAG TPA: hypothetical protein VFS11_06915 [Gemmatimonadales bacterium]|nr:hypothetical protein [Gemmatimonadales bacterium]